MFQLLSMMKRRDITSLNFWRCQKLPFEIFVCEPLIFLFSNCSSQMVLSPVNCLAEIHFNTSLNLQNGKIVEVLARARPTLYPLKVYP